MNIKSIIFIYNNYYHKKQLEIAVFYLQGDYDAITSVDKLKNKEISMSI